MTLYDNRIAANWDVALNSLTNIQAITPTGDRAFFSPQVYGTYNPGLYRIKADGTVYVAGYAELQWIFAVLTRKQYEYLRSTYCSGGWSGKVTIYTPAGTSTYQRLNAVMILPHLADTDGKFFAFKNFTVQMARLRAAA